MGYGFDEGPVILTVDALGKSQHTTPQGYLLCKDVPVARTGEMVYMADELPELDADNYGLIRVSVAPEVLFDPATIASFEGMDVTNGHPDDLLDPDSWQESTRGVMLNVRRGVGADSNYLMADLLIKEAQAIRDVRAGKRQVSLGYDADYSQDQPGRAVRTRMVGNHMALALRGRCGPGCAIGDEDMGKENIVQKLMKAFASKDEDAFKKTLDEMPDAVGGAPVHNVNVHVHGNGEKTPDGTATVDADDPDKAAEAEAKKKADAATKDALTAAMKPVMDSIDSFGKRLEAVEKRVTKDAPDDKGGDKEGGYDDPLKVKGKTGDDDPEGKAAGLGDRSDNGTKITAASGKATDAASVKLAIQDTRARAEILVPGVEYPTFDSADAVKTYDGLCLFKRRVLKAYMAKDAKAVPGDPKTMTCDAVDVAFAMASNTAAHSNNTRSVSFDAAANLTYAQDGREKNEKINMANKDFWSKQTTRVA